jgi:plasmid stabilization system protein ParE
LNDVVSTAATLGNLRAIRAYIERFNPTAAGNLAAAMIAAGNSLRTSPHRGRPVRNTGMRELLTSYPYVIRYRVTGDGVVILRVRHTSRRPTKP